MLQRKVIRLLRRLHPLVAAYLVPHCQLPSMDIASPALSPAASTRELLPLLAALSLVGRSAAGCLGKVLAALSARKALDAAKVARGLEAIITGVHSLL